MSIKTMQEKYGKTKKRRALFNSAIRAECTGGTEVLELMATVSRMRWETTNKLYNNNLLVIENELQEIRNTMVAQIQEEWKI